MIYTLSDYNDSLKLKLMYAQKIIPHLYHIYIETTNYCNNNCSFCPVGMGKRKEDPYIMDIYTYKKLIDMISNSSLTHNIKISLYGNNEPLLDPTIVDKINYVKTSIPTAYTYISTNGLLLEQYIDDLYKSTINCIYVQAYTEETYTNVCAVLQSKQYEYETGIFTTTSNSKIYVVPRFNTPYTLMNRAGQAYTTDNIPNMCCICPFVDMHISSTGDIQMCTFDALGETIFDNIFNYNTFDEAWNSQKYKEIRVKMLKKGKFGFDACSKCDIYSNSYRLHFYNLE